MIQSENTACCLLFFCFQKLTFPKHFRTLVQKRLDIDLRLNCLHRLSLEDASVQLNQQITYTNIQEGKR